MAVKANLDPKDSEVILNIFFDCIMKGLKNNQRAEFRGFGTFRMKHYKNYVGRNPKDGSCVEVKAKRLAVFKAANELREKINKNKLAKRN
ncbi:MAG: integration host factor subunit beta [Deltaproteobacteria bacterium]|jgi:integration host factor subunit beta|nr:integration host factor subunit beta [Deltaproteobacteria bacterium]